MTNNWKKEDIHPEEEIRQMRRREIRELGKPATRCPTRVGICALRGPEIRERLAGAGNSTEKGIVLYLNRYIRWYFNKDLKC